MISFAESLDFIGDRVVCVGIVDWNESGGGLTVDDAAGNLLGFLKSVFRKEGDTRNIM